MSVLLLAFLIPTQAHAITINVEVEDCGFTNPSDPDSSGLLAISEAAAEMWMAVAPADDPTEYNLVYCWDEFSDPSTLGSTWPDPWGNASFNVDQTWFIDPTPFDSSEFDMQQVFAQDLSSAQLGAWFEDDPPPGLLEVGFNGAAVTTDAGAGFDLLSVVLHEMGHSVGVNYAWGEDYDILPQFVSGADNTDIVAVLDHLADLNALMAPSIAPGMRSQISAVDVFAAADDEGWDTVRLERVELLGFIPGDPQMWSDPLAWVGGAVPTSATQVTARGPVSVFMPAEAGSLTLMGSPLDLFGTTLDVDGAVSVDGLSAVRGHGRIDAGSFANGGEITADDGGTGEPLEIVVSGGCDLGGGEIDALAGDVRVAPASGVDPFDGALLIDAGRTVSVESLFVLGAGSSTSLTGSGTKPATLKGDHLTFANDSELSVDGPSVLSGELTVTDASVWLFPGADLTIEDDARFSNFTMDSSDAGIVHQLGDLAVEGTSRIDVATYDWDGTGSARTTVKGSYAIEAGTVSDSAGYTGRAEVFGTLNVTVGSTKEPKPWVIGKNGLLLLHQDGTVVPTLSGSNLTLRSGGAFEGQGTFYVDITNDTGVVRPSELNGHVFGTLSSGRGSDYTQIKGGTLEIDIDKNGSSDKLALGGTATLGGTLIVKGASPAVGTTYTLITAPKIVGAFTLTQLPTLTSGSWKLATVTVGSHQELRLSVIP